ncbi:MAG: permease DsdX [Verrucomicrobia bacterium]|nr:permease DsdX [Verrucomicrobiota bacterium]
MLALAHNTSLLLFALFAIVALVVLIAHFKLNAFVALILASLFVGLVSGMKLPEIGRSFGEGVGAVLSSVAIVVGLGTILGKLLAESGGAEVIAQALIGVLGEKRLHWAVMVIAFIAGIPVWFTVGLVLLIPIVFTLAKETGTPLLRLGIPLVAGLSVAHGLVPPHPGPMAAIELFKADAGRTILYSLLVGFPTAVIAGPIFGKYAARRIHVELGGIGAQLSKRSAARTAPGFSLTILTILLPILLMMFATVVQVAVPPTDATLKSNLLREWSGFLGSPTVAMLAGVLFCYYSFGLARGFDKQQISKFSEECLGPVALVLLVVGAGGGFSKVLVASGVSQAMADLIRGTNISPICFGWFVAALIRIATGSATVAITTAAGIVAPIAATVPGTNSELVIIAMGAGSAILSHLNDGGFWFVKEYLNMSVAQTLKSWTVMETIISIVALVFVLLLDALL